MKRSPPTETGGSPAGGATAGRRDLGDGALAERWARLARDLAGEAGPGGGASEEGAGERGAGGSSVDGRGRELFRQLVDAYRAPGRVYHGVTHLISVLTLLDELCPDQQPPAAWARAAVWFHDAVYDPTRDDNEAASAAWARRALPAVGAAPAPVELAARLVEATALHRLDADLAERPASACFLDADLAVLGSPTDVYDAYAAAIRLEYRHLDDHAFRRGRAQVLTGLAARSPLFLSDRGRLRFEAPARANIARELTALTGTG